MCYYLSHDEAHKLLLPHSDVAAAQICFQKYWVICLGINPPRCRYNAKRHGIMSVQMKSVCPKCKTIFEIKPGYAGLVTCNCGVRFDAFAHVYKPVNQIIQKYSLVTTVSSVNLPFIESNPILLLSAKQILGLIKQKFLSIYCQMKKIILNLNRSDWLVLLFTVMMVILSSLFFVDKYRSQEKSQSIKNKLKQVQSKVAPTIVHAPIFNSSSLVFSEIEFNSAGRNNYFLSANLKNTAQSAAQWPVIEVTLLYAGKPIGQKLVTPIEYLPAKSQINLEPDQIVKVRMNLEFQDGSSMAEDYRVRPIYLEK